MTPPERDCIKINVDAATGVGCMAMGVVARNEFGIVLYSATNFECCDDDDLKALTAEARAYQMGLDIAYERFQHTKTTIEGDSKLMTGYINEMDRKPPWQLRSTVKDCRRLLRSNDLFFVSFVSRTANNAAHKLARFAISNRASNTWQYATPDCIKDVVALEASNISPDD